MTIHVQYMYCHSYCNVCGYYGRGGVGERVKYTHCGTLSIAWCVVILFHDVCVCRREHIYMD